MKKIITFLSLIAMVLHYGQNLTSTENFFYSRSYLTPVTTESPGTPQVQTVQYFDGLGRPVQSVGIKASPTGKDVAVPVVYDENGRVSKSYLPLPVNTQNGAYNPAITPAAVNTYYNVPNAYSEVEIEKSPLARVLKVAAPGSHWQMSGGNTQKNAYLANGSSEVKRLKATTIWDASSKIYNVSLAFASNDAFTTNGFYNPKTLFKIVTKDEDNNEMQSFVNSNGQQIMVRKHDPAGGFLDTYYVYDDNGNLSFMIPPKAADFTSIAQLNSKLDGLCYQYKYDKYNRLVEKKLPGRDFWEYVVYDRLGRPVLSQDANQHNQRWSYVKYDKQGRLVYNGIFTSSLSRANLQSTLYNASYAASNESRVTSSFSANSQSVYYTNTAFPTSNFSVLAVHYYDEYPMGSPVKPVSILGADTLNETPTSFSANGYTSSRSTKSLPTASMIKNVEDNNWTQSYAWYDQKSRVVGTHINNHLGGFTKKEIELDFAGAVKKSIINHSRASQSSQVEIEENFTYDSQYRLLSHKHKVDGNPEVTLSENTYNDMSQLISKNISSGLQHVNYTYNIRGWLTGINENAYDDVIGSNKLFSYKLKYDEPQDTSYFSGRSNGSISEVDWVYATGSVIKKRYNYNYDGVNRLTEAYYSNPDISIPYNGFNDEVATYDQNGNISYLRRYATPFNTSTPELIDELDYSYSGNKVTGINDASGNPSGYEGGNGDIQYDPNGNMIAMYDKMIEEISYNHLNLPTKISYSNSERDLQYLYRSDGTKLKKSFLYKNGNGAMLSTTTEYLDGFHYAISTGADLWEEFLGSGQGMEAFVALVDEISYSNNQLKFFPTSEGFYDYENNKYIYQYKDHLGNVRLSYYDNGSSAEVLDVNDYYPFGMNFLRDEESVLGVGSGFNYKYNGKEMQETGMYDYGWRQYMPDIGRWFGMDQLSEKFNSTSPYAYVLNNPISFLDPDGRDIIPNANGWSFTGTDMQLLIKYLQGGNSLKPMVSSLQASESLTNNFEGSGINSFWSSFTSSGGGGSSGWHGASVKGSFVYYWTDGQNNSDTAEEGTTNMHSLDGKRFKINTGNVGNNDMLNPATVGNWIDIYTGPNNPKTYQGNDYFGLAPANLSDAVSKQHDLDYANLRLAGPMDVFIAQSAISADWKFVKGQFYAASLMQFTDPSNAWKGYVSGIGIGAVATPKTIVYINNTILFNVFSTLQKIK